VAQREIKPPGVAVGAPVVTDDLMNTDVQGRTNLRFIDQSNLDIGPGSDVKIDRFVYNPNRTAGASISLVKGGPATMIPIYAGISAAVVGGDIPIAEHSVSAAQAPRTREATDMTCPFHRSGRWSAWSSICAAIITYVSIKIGGA
jgi:hypothetical protein